MSCLLVPSSLVRRLAEVEDVLRHHNCLETLVMASCAALAEPKELLSCWKPILDLEAGWEVLFVLFAVAAAVAALNQHPLPVPAFSWLLRSAIAYLLG